MDTLLLTIDVWDLTTDANNNVAAASNPYSQAQDAASAIRTFIGECYYDTTLGVPYWAQILGKRPPISLMKAKFVAEALTVTGIISAQCFLSAITDRTISGQVQIVNSDSQKSVASFG